jgi:hypothetical protein
MKVEILKCSGKEYWYKNFIGVTFPVLEKSISSEKYRYQNTYGDIYASNVSITFSISEPAFCDAWLTLQLNPNQTIGGEEVHISGESFEAKYRYLSDGYYNFNIVCYDDFNNNLVIVKEILVEGNSAITNPLPRGTTYNNINLVTLSVDSSNAATCKFDSEKRTYENSRETFSNTGNLFHSQAFLSSNMQTLSIDENESKPYIYYTSCKFDNGTITEQIDGDVISFTIDKIPPTVHVLAKSEGQGILNFEPYEMTLANWYYNRNFKLICDDYDSAIPVAQFGCATIEYCFAQGANLETFTIADCEGTLYSTTENEVSFKVTEEDESYKHLYYRARDKGGNIGAFQRTHMKLRDVSFIPPRVYLD